MLKRKSPNLYFLGPMELVSVLIFMYLLSYMSPTDAYDTLDPNGNITIKWDIMRWDDETYSVRESIFNFQLFRHVERPGWRLSFEWKGEEVIWGIAGAEATKQGNCSGIKGSKLPHSCDKKPDILDLLPEAPYNMQTSNCCKGGVLSSMIQDPSRYGAGFEMTVGMIPSYNCTELIIKENFTLAFQAIPAVILLWFLPVDLVMTMAVDGHKL